MEYIVYIALFGGGFLCGALTVAIVNLYSYDKGWRDGYKDKEEDEV